MSEYRLLGAKLWQKPFRPPAFVYNNKRPVILSFLSFRKCEIINRLLKHLVSKNRLHISEPTFTLNIGVFREEKREFRQSFSVKKAFLLLLTLFSARHYCWNHAKGILGIPEESYTDR